MLVGLDLPLAGGGTEAGVQSPHRGNCLRQGETFKAESETADLWLNEKKTVLAAALCRAGQLLTVERPPSLP